MDTQPESELMTVRAVLREEGLSNSEIKQGAERGKIRLRGVPTSDMGRLVLPHDVEYVPDAPRLTPGRDVAILYRDDDLAVVCKPSGLLSVKAQGRGGDRNLVGYLSRLFGKAYAVHRLDEQTSGVMMVALNERTQFEIKRLLEHHDVERRYLALVRGFPSQERWSMETDLVRDRGDGKRGSGRGDDAKRAFTEFALVEKLPGGTALIEATLETGRTHQVRIHLAESGHPVLGDKLYGDMGSSRRCPRVALHAAVLGLEHPMTGEELYFDVPLADDLERVRRAQITRAEKDSASLPRGGRPRGEKSRPSQRSRGPKRAPKRGRTAKAKKKR